MNTISRIRVERRTLGAEDGDSRAVIQGPEAASATAMGWFEPPRLKRHTGAALQTGLAIGVKAADRIKLNAQHYQYLRHLFELQAESAAP